MTAILFAKDDTTNGDIPTPSRGRVANSRALQAMMDRRHAGSIAGRLPASKHLIMLLPGLAIGHDPPRGLADRDF